MSLATLTTPTYVHSPAIMVVDDEAHCRELVCYALADLGLRHTVFIANTGDDALRQIAELTAAGNVPQIVLLDLELPGEHGRDILRDMRLKPTLQSMVCIIMTSVDDLHERRLCLELGADDYWVKPNSYGGLLSLMSGLHRWLDKDCN